jgi:hypothetical protein
MSLTDKSCRLMCLLVSLLGLTFAASCSGADEEISTVSTNEDAKPHEVVAREFLEALMTHDVGTLRSFASNFGGGQQSQWDSEIEEFLFRDAGDWLSVTSIAKIAPLEIVIVYQSDVQFLALYVPKSSMKSVKSDEFLQTQWMKKYFACQFKKTAGSWKLYMNFCFAETDGPYPSDYP